MNNFNRISDDDLRAALAGRRERMAQGAPEAAERAERLMEMLAREKQAAEDPKVAGPQILSKMWRKGLRIAASVAIVATTAVYICITMANRNENVITMAEIMADDQTIRLVVPENGSMAKAEAKPQVKKSQSARRRKAEVMSEHDRRLAEIIELESDADRMANRRIDAPCREMDEMINSRLAMLNSPAVSYPTITEPHYSSNISEEHE